MVLALLRRSIVGCACVLLHSLFVEWVGCRALPDGRSDVPINAWTREGALCETARLRRMAVQPLDEHDACGVDSSADVADAQSHVDIIQGAA